tara:strand:- start:527 stop:1558 length:1032 start_codon:yes stop_codon:yes gene_type:complete
MALTDTKASKTFVAGAPDIILKGDYRRDKPEMKMASDDMNERFLEQLYEQLLDEGFSPEEAAKKARQLFEERSMADGGRAQYGLGSIVKGVKKAVKGVGKGIKSLISSDAGKLALLAAGGYYLGGGNLLGLQRAGMSGFSFGNLPGATAIGNFFTGGSKASNALKIAGVGGAITGLLAEMEQQPGESDSDFAQRQAQVKDQLKIQFSRLYPKGENESPEEYDVRINALVENADDQTVDVGNMAEGGRVGRAFGSDKLVEQASGIEKLPININSKGVKELDMRETGGFIPPVGVKEKADDIPAMLSNNEFVFTADAVRAAGGGSVNKGAQRMYDLMKNLESKVV